MPANLTPEYKKAEAAYKRARDPQDRLELLGDMNRDGRLDGADIDPFFACLGGGICP